MKILCVFKGITAITMTLNLKFLRKVKYMLSCAIRSSPTQVKIESICPAVASKGKTSSEAQHLSIFWLKNACRQWRGRPRTEERKRGK